MRIHQRVGKNTSVSAGPGWLALPVAGLLGVGLCGARAIEESRVAAGIFLLAVVSLVVYAVKRPTRKR